jgi:hypothetical protein
MSFNRLSYDNCTYRQDLRQSVGELSYVLDPAKYENCNKCRHELGLVGGTNVSHNKGNLVDLENDLRGQTRPFTKCPDYKYHPNQNSDEKVHLPSCQMIDYKPVPLPPAMDLSQCKK